jgi:D-amino-acid dehydrogenase
MKKNNKNLHHVTIIGAGIVGISCALNLLRDGHTVTVVDRNEPGEGCSKGNAGVFSNDYYVPLSIPGMLTQVPRWLLDPLGPLSIRFRHLPEFLPWLIHFLRAGFPARVEEICNALEPLLMSSLEEHQALAKGTEAENLIRAKGCMYVYENEKILARDATSWKLRISRGTEFERLNAEQIREREPALAPIYEIGYFLSDIGHTVEPMLLVKGLAKSFKKSGGVILKREVRDILAGPDGPKGLITDQGVLDVNILVISAGAFSNQLTARLGSPVPLQGERGYHATISNSGKKLNVPIIVNNHKFIATPMSTGIRFAGTAEYGGLDAKPNYARSQVLVQHAKKMLPGLDTSKISEWSGLRPTLPDSLPVIGPSPHLPNLFFAFGHQHIGLTAGPRTGRLISDLIAKRTPNMDLHPFRSNRF